MYTIKYIKINNFNYNYLYFFFKAFYILNYNLTPKNKNYKLYLYNVYVLYYNHFNINKNFLPIRFKLKKNCFLKKLKKFKTNIIICYFNNFLINFLNFFLNKKLFFSVKKINKSIKKFKNNKIIKVMSWKLKKYYRFTHFKNFFREFIKMLWLSFLFKDGKFFLSWFCYFMEKIYLKKHKKLLNLLKLILIRYFNFFFLKLNVQGIFFDIRGKLGVTGNAKKRHFKINFGSSSSTTKKNKVNYNQSIIRTNTGVLGVTFCIYF